MISTSCPPRLRAACATTLLLAAAACGGGDGATPPPPPNPVPRVTGLDPATIPAGAPSPIVVVAGTGFIASSVVRFRGSERPTTYVSATELRVLLLQADLAASGSGDITVISPAPGGGESNPATLTILFPVPFIGSLTPDAFPAGTGDTALAVNGGGFVPQSVVVVGGTPRQTTYVSATQLRAKLPAAELTGAATFAVRVQNPQPGGGETTSLMLEVRAATPSVDSLAPGSFAMQGDAGATLGVLGNGFASNSLVTFNGTPRPTSWVSATRLNATLSADDLRVAGNYDIRVVSPAPGGGTSSAVTYQVRAPIPVVSSLSPAQTEAGQEGASLRVNGTGFQPSSVVRVGGQPRPTAMVSATQLVATLSAPDLVSAGSREITVFTPTPGGGTSNPATLTVVYAAPTLTGLPSRGATAGRPGFTLTVYGTGFAPGSVVRWDGADRATTFISSTRLAAVITAGDVASPRAAAVTVHNPAPGGGTSAPAGVQVRAQPASTLTSIRTVNVAANAVVWSPATGLLYASVSGSDPAYGNTVIAIDPVSGAVTGSVGVGSDPGVMAVSADGQVLYVALDGSNTVRRIAAASLTPGVEWTLPAGSVADEIEVMPGAPNTVVVAPVDHRFSPGSAGVCMYDSGVLRGSCVGGGNSIAVSDDASEIYGYYNESSEFGFRTVSVFPGGLAVTRLTTSLIGGYYTHIRQAAGRVYANTGQVVDAGRHVRVGTVGSGTTSLPDAALGRVFVLDDAGVITAYDMNLFASIGTVATGAVNLEHPALSHIRLIRWGTDGLAFRDGVKVVIVRTPLAGP